MFPCYLLSADIAERKEQWDLAEHFYQLAATDLELHQTRLHHDDLRVTFFKGKYRVYEALVWLSFRKLDEAESVGSAYAGSERAKSRGLIDLLSQHLPAVHGRGEQPLAAKIERLREELNVL